MKKLLALLMAISLGRTAEAQVPYEAGHDDFNDGWLFVLEDGDYAPVDTDDADWETVSLPHDWSIAQPFDSSLEAESGFLPGGTGWYRKHFTVEEGGRFFVCFDGVMGTAEVYINGVRLGMRPYGYSSFRFELTEHLAYGKDNVLAVRVDNPVPSSRWYAGSGINRDVALVHKGNSFIDDESITVTYGDVQENGSIAVKVNGTTIGQGTVKLSILDPTGHIIASAENFGTEMVVPDAMLWSVDDVNIYTLRADLYEQNKRTDRVLVPFGFRYAVFDRETGFSLNGVNMKLKGVCLHHDQGALGAAAQEDAFRRQIRLLKEMGCNAVRLAHNPADPDFLRICLEEGVLVVCEAFDTWTNPKNANWYDYSAWFNETVKKEDAPWGITSGITWAEADIRTMVREGRNNPAVILWSIGNEILGNIGGDVSAYADYAGNLCRWVKEEDPTRPVTIADNMSGRDSPYAEMQAQMNKAVVENGGVIGLNYINTDIQDELYRENSGWILYCSETVSELSSRGIYRSAGTDITAYDRERVEWGTTAADGWLNVISRDYIAGEFVWTGFDYIGEPEPWNGLGPGSVTGKGPSPNASYFGIIDTAGMPKDSYWFYMSQWRDDVDVLHILPAWNSGDLTVRNGSVDVIVYSNLPSVELFLNGESLGRKYYTVNDTALGYRWYTSGGRPYYSWSVPYEEGTLEAVGYDREGKETVQTSGRRRVCTYGRAAGIVLVPEKKEVLADGASLLYVRADIVDADGQPVNGARNRLSFSLTGSGEIIGVDNGDASDTDPWTPSSPQTAARKAYSGSAVVIIRTQETEGDIVLRVQAEGLTPAQITVPARPLGKNAVRWCWKNTD